MTALTRTVQRIAPGPRGLAALSAIRSYKRDPNRLGLQLQQQFGDVVRNPLGPYITHQVSHPACVEHVLQTNYQNYCRGKFYAAFKLFMGEGLLTNDGAAWIDHRRLAQPLFHRRSVERMATHLTDATDVMLARWQERRQPDAPIDIVPEMLRLSLSMLGRVLFSTDLGDHAATVAPAVRVWQIAMIQHTGSISSMLPAWLPSPQQRRLEQARRTLDAVIGATIDAHQRPDASSEDLVALLLAGRDPQTGATLSRQQVHNELMTIFLAGHETTATALSWALYLIATHPDMRHRLEAELSSVLGERVPTVADLAQLPYLSMVVDETLRLYPPVWGFPRDAVAEDTIGGYHIPAGSTVFLSPFITHRHPAFWDNPEAFDPERFTPEQVAQRPKFAYMPFGGGPRLCIGKHLALLELQLGIAMIAQRYHLHPLPGHPVLYGPHLSLRPLHGVQVTLHPRRYA